MKAFKLAFAAGVVAVATGCASGLNSMEKRQYTAWQHEGVLVEEKSPTAGAWLGLLPGVGSFYAREPALGIVNLLLWPASILWDPVSGHRGAQSINYVITKAEVERKHQAAISKLDLQLAQEQIDQREYIIQKARLSNQYAIQ